VLAPYIAAMTNTKLQEWMTRNKLNDGEVAKRLKSISRVQISRIRRGVACASTKTAMQLQQLTGIRWHHFVRQPPKMKRSR